MKRPHDQYQIRPLFNVDDLLRVDHPIKKPMWRGHFGNKVMKKMAAQRYSMYRFNLFWKHVDPDAYYQCVYESKKQKGKSKDDWDIGYWSMSKTNGTTIVWLD